jgi:AcrR family transcriptional regulator
VKQKSKAKVDYHHGDLRNALISAGVTLLRDQSPDQLSLRGLAKQAGVSHNAPYQHFTDREDLLAAIAEQGFELLNKTVLATHATAGGDALVQLRSVRAYVDFAIAHPHHFQVMFTVFKTREHPELTRATERSLRILHSIVQDAQTAGAIISGDTFTFACVLWAQMHGIASIAIARKLPLPGNYALETLLEHSFASLLSGVLKRAH